MELTLILTLQSAIKMDQCVHFPGKKQVNAKCKTFIHYVHQVKHQTLNKIKNFRNGVVSLWIPNEPQRFYQLVSLSYESFQFQMRIPFPFLRSKDLRTSLLIMRTRSFFTLLYLGGTYARLVYTWYRNIFRMIAVLIVCIAANRKKGI